VYLIQQYTILLIISAQTRKHYHISKGYFHLTSRQRSHLGNYKLQELPLWRLI